MQRGLDLARRIAWARQGITGWTYAREAAIQLLLAGVSVVHVAYVGGTDRQWVHKWWTRFQKSGHDWDSLHDHSSRPRTIHTTRHDHEPAILTTKARFPHYGAKKIHRVAGVPLSHGTIHRVLQDWGLVNISKQRGKRRKYKRFQRSRPNALWQLDITQVRLDDENGTQQWIASIIDDHSRIVLASRVYDQELNTGDVIALVHAAIRSWGRPKQGLTDRGCQFHTNSDHPSLFTLDLAGLGIRHIKARPRHPRTCGKIERWHRALKEEWLDQGVWPRSRSELRERIAAWLEHYNNERPHASLDYRTPLEVYSGAYIPRHGLRRLVNEVL